MFWPLSQVSIHLRQTIIDAVAERIAKFIEREWAEDEIRKHRNRDE